MRIGWGTNRKEISLVGTLPNKALNEGLGWAGAGVSKQN